MEKLNPEVKTLWINALRSGEFPQGVLSLSPTRTQKATPNRALFGDTYCCLGVLSVLCQRKTGLLTDAEIFGPYGSEVSTHPVVDKWSGVSNYDVPASVALEVLSTKPDSCNHYFMGVLQGLSQEGKTVSLPDLNDHHVSFEDIATIIEKAL